jgi:predicted negative regulator of RcsB-dependent stress response
MDAREIKAIVDDFSQWKGNAYTLATLIAAAQRESDANKADAAGQSELADQIRGG